MSLTIEIIPDPELGGFTARRNRSRGFSKLTFGVLGLIG